MNNLLQEDLISDITGPFANAERELQQELKQRRKELLKEINPNITNKNWLVAWWVDAILIGPTPLITTLCGISHIPPGWRIDALAITTTWLLCTIIYITSKYSEQKSSQIAQPVGYYTRKYLSKARETEVEAQLPKKKLDNPTTNLYYLDIVSKKIDNEKSLADKVIYNQLSSLDDSIQSLREIDSPEVDVKDFLAQLVQKRTKLESQRRELSNEYSKTQSEMSKLKATQKVFSVVSSIQDMHHLSQSINTSIEQNRELIERAIAIRVAIQSRASALMESNSITSQLKT